MRQSVFGNLTLKNQLEADEKYSEIDYIFQNSASQLKKFSVIEVERTIALDNLRSLTKRLQSNRLKQNAKVFCKYFSD